MDNRLMSSDFKNLSYLIGQEIEIKSEGIYRYRQPEYAEVIAEYPKTILVEMTFIKSEWVSNMPPRKVRMLIPKAKMAVGDALIRLKSTGIYLVGEEITEFRF